MKGRGKEEKLNGSILKCSTIPKKVWPGHLKSFRLSKSCIFPEQAYLNIHAMFSHWLVAANGQWCLKTNHSDRVQGTSAWVRGQFLQRSERLPHQQTDKGLNWYSNQVYVVNLTKIHQNTKIKHYAYIFLSQTKSFNLILASKYSFQHSLNRDNILISC